MRVAGKAPTLLTSLVLSSLVAIPLQALEVPYLSGRVVDQADLLSAQQEQELTQRLEALEQQTTAQLVVLTIPSLEGEVLEDYSLRVAETWRLGQAEEDNGVLLLVARDDRKLRLEVGYGLEGRLTDLESKVILDEIIVPRFRQGDFAGGIEDGVDVVVRKVSGEDVDLPEPGAGGSALDDTGALVFLAVWAFGVLPFILVSLFSKGGHSWFLFFFLMPFVSLFPSAVFGFKAGGVCLLAWVVVFLLVKLWLNTPAGSRWLDSKPGWIQWTRTSGGGFSGGSSGGFSSGGFSGGGGSFGGGGSSSSW